MDCVFCKILDGSIPSKRVWEDDEFIIIRDIEPKAKQHYLAIPKYHQKFIRDCNQQQMQVVAHILKEVSLHQKELGLTNGYRIIINQGDDANQTVPHLHIHFLGGEKLKD